MKTNVQPPEQRSRKDERLALLMEAMGFIDRPAGESRALPMVLF